MTSINTFPIVFSNTNDTFNTDTQEITSITTKTTALDFRGLELKYDLNATPKQFSISDGGVRFRDGTNDYTTGLERLALVQTAFQAVELPPNATTLKLNDTILLDAGVASTNNTINETGMVITDPNGSSTHTYQLLNLVQTGVGQNILNPDTITCIRNGAGGGLNPQLILQNTNATGSVVQEVYKNKPTPNVNGDVLHSLLVYGKDAGNLKQEFGRIVFTTRDNTSGTEDGSIEFGVQNAGVATTFLQINGIENEINAFKNLDMGGNTIRTNTGDMNILSTTSSGTGVMTIASKGALNIGSATDNIIATSSLQMTADKQIFLTDSSPAIVSTQLGNGEIRVDDITNLSRAIVRPTDFTIQDTSVGTTNTYNINGFTKSDNSIQANSNNGFVLNSGSTTNSATLNLQKIEVFNSGANNQDTILLQNTGSANPVLNLQTANTSTNINDSMGASTSGMGLTRQNQLTFAVKQIAINNPPSSPCIIQHIDQIDNQPFIIGTPNSLDLSMGQDFILNGSNIISGSSGSNSGQHLRILLNGTYYKIQLLND